MPYSIGSSRFTSLKCIIIYCADNITTEKRFIIISRCYYSVPSYLHPLLETVTNQLFIFTVPGGRLPGN